MGLACLKGAGQWSGDPVCLWIPSLTGLGGVAQQNRDHVCGSLAWQALGDRLAEWILCRPGGHGPVEWRLYLCVSQAQALGAWPGRAEIVQACAGRTAWPGRDRKCLWIPGLAGLKCWSGGDCAGLRGGSLG
jgi:hypothetical protein